MLPTTTKDNCIHRHQMHPVLVCECLLRCAASSVQTTDLAHIRWSQDTTRFVAALCNHVGRVLGLRSEEEVFRVATQTVVAPVQHAGANWKRPHAQLPSDPVGQEGFRLAPHLAVTRHLERSLPGPTGLWLTAMDMAPEQGLEGRQTL